MADPIITLLTDDQKVEAARLRDDGYSYKKLSDRYGVSQMTIRRAIDDRYKVDKPKYIPTANPHPTPRVPQEDRAIRINDWPDTLTAALLGDPTPGRRAFIREQRG